MGHVFEAVDTETGRAVAAKIMMLEGERDLESLMRFQQEGAVLSTLKHPNIVEVYGTFLEEHTSSIIMELLKGRSLWAILAAERLPLARTKALMLQVCAALEYAHGHGIVHRDVKPSNIMVVENDHVKVTDFGIARVLGAGDALRTMTGTTMGTPFYMSPEQITAGPIDARTDIYSVGVVLYEMVTGRRPFESDDPISVAFMHVNRAPQPPSEITGDVPADWEAIIVKCLAKGPSDRYPSAAALQEAIASAGEAALDRPVPESTDAAPQQQGTAPATIVRASPDTAPPATVEGANPDPAPPAAVEDVHPGAGPPATAVRAGADTAPPPPVVQAPVNPPDAAPVGAASPPASAVPSASEEVASPPADSASKVLPEAVPVRGRGISRRMKIVGAAVIALIALAGIVAYQALSTKSSGSPAATGTSPGRAHPTAVTGTGGVVTRQWGAAGSQQGQFNHPRGATLDARGNVYIADSGNNRIQQFTSSGAFLRTWGQNGAAATRLNAPRGIALDKQGNLYVADTGNNRIVKFGPSGSVVAAWGRSGSGKVEFRGPTALTIVHGNIYVADTGNNRIQVLTPSGSFLGCWGQQSMCVGAQFSHPAAVAVDRLSDLFVADAGSNHIQEMTLTGDLVNSWGSKGSGPGELRSPEGVSLDGAGNVYVADTGNDRIEKFDSNGNFLSQWGQSGTGPGMFNGLTAVRSDPHGNLYVVDTGNDRVQVLSIGSPSSGQSGQ
jgi:sugar lactone lactonase YvrE